jgi:hypothetical protein
MISGRMKDSEEIYIGGEKFYLRKVKWPLCTGCYFFGNCPGIDCTRGNGVHEFILTKTQNEKIHNYIFVSCT